MRTSERPLLGVWPTAGLLWAVLLGVVMAESDLKDAKKVFCFRSLYGDGHSAFDHEIQDVWRQHAVNWTEYDGHVTLVVNVASFWGSTLQYPPLNALQSDFADVRVLGVPCNQFGLQEPGKDATEILNTLKYVRPGSGFEPNFELTEKIDVNGEGEHPLYTYLKSKCPPVCQSFAPKAGLHYTGLKASDIRWNFEKFLLDRNGKPVIRYSEKVGPQDIYDDIKALLAADPRTG